MNRWLKYGGIEIEPSKIPVNLISVENITLLKTGELIKFPLDIYFTESFRVITDGSEVAQGIRLGNSFEPGTYKLIINLTVNKQSSQTSIGFHRVSNNSFIANQIISGSGTYTRELTATVPFYITLLTNLGGTGDNFSADIIVNNINLIKV